MKGETLIAIVSIVISAIISITTLISNNELQKELLNTKQKYELQIFELEKNHDMEIMEVKNSSNKNNKRCDEINTIMEDLTIMIKKGIKEKENSNRENLSYFKALYYLDEEDKVRISKIPNKSHEKKLRILMSSIITQYGECHR